MTEGIILDEASDFMQSMDDAPHVPLHKALRAVLANVEGDRARPVTPAWASRLVQQYVGVEFKDLKFLNNYLLDMLAEIRDCTENLCSLHSELLQDSLSAADDLEDHRDFYVLLIGEWQKSCTSTSAGGTRTTITPVPASPPTRRPRTSSSVNRASSVTSRRSGSR